MNNDPDFFTLACELNKGKPNPYKNVTKNNIFDIHKKQITKLKKDCLSLKFPNKLDTISNITTFRKSVDLFPKIMLNITYNLYLFVQANNNKNLGFSTDELKTHDDHQVSLELMSLIMDAKDNLYKKLYKQKKYVNIDSKLVNVETLNQYGNILPDKMYTLFLSNLENQQTYRLVLGLDILVANSLPDPTACIPNNLSKKETEQLKNFLLKAAD